MDQSCEVRIMKSIKTGIKALFLTTIAVLLLMSSCTHPRNTTSYAILSGQVLLSPDEPYGVEGVTVWVESDSESELPYHGGDVTVTTDVGGEYYVRIFLGFTTQEDAMGGFAFDPEQPQYVGDARMLFFYEDLYFDLGGGVSLEMGQTINMPILYLSQFMLFGGPPE
jgi:hypothetical protein